MAKKRSGPKAIQHREFLSLLGKSKQPKRRKLLLKAATCDEIKAIAECALNLLEHRIKITSAQKRKLKPYKNALRFVSSKQVNLKKKRNILEQKGGFLATLLPLAVSALSSIVPALFGQQ